MPEGGKPYTEAQAIEQAIAAGNPQDALDKLAELGFRLEPTEPKGEDKPPADDGEGTPMDRLRGDAVKKAFEKHVDGG